MAGSKRGPYKYKPALPSEISKYASQHGVFRSSWRINVFQCA